MSGHDSKDQIPRSRRWKVPLVAVVTAVIVVGVGVVVDRDSAPRPVAEASPLPDLLRRIDEATAAQRPVDLTGDQVVYQELRPSAQGASPTEMWTTADGSADLVRQGAVSKPVDVYVSTEGSPLERAIHYPSYRTLRALGDTAPQALLSELARAARGINGGADVYAFTRIQQMLAVGVVPPAVRAMLFHAMASIPGVTIDRTRLVLGKQWTAVDVSTGSLAADQDFRYVFAGPAPALGADPVGRKARRHGFGPLRNAGAFPAGTVTLSVPDPYDALAPATSVTFRDRVGDARAPRWPLHYTIRSEPVSADVTGDGHTDLVTVIDVHGTAEGGPPESSFAIVVYVRDASGLVPFGVVRLVPPLSTGPAVTVTDGVVTITPTATGKRASYRWNGVWFAPTS